MLSKPDAKNKRIKRISSGTLWSLMRSGSIPENAQSRFVARHFMPRPMKACPPSDVMMLSVVFGVSFKSTEMGEMGSDYVF